MTLTITEFLEARIAEDEAAAERCASVIVVPAAVASTMIDPVRMLAECAAKRAILAEHSPVDPCDAHDADYRTITCDTICAIAGVYKDHPDYRQEWAL